jgi:tetratricopeptide (TPR) repeat protein
MERKIAWIAVIMLFAQIAASAQADKKIYNAYISGDMNAWKKRMLTLENGAPESRHERLDLVNYYYGYIAWSIDQDRKEEAREYIQKAESIMNDLEKVDYRLPNIYAYRSAFVGFEIALARRKAPFLGPKSLEFAKQSVQLDSDNSFGYVQLGNIEFYTPALFGGSKEVAMQHYRNAVRIMEKKPDHLKNNWNYVNLLATIIQAYMETGQYDKALDYCKKTLKYEPRFDWVKNELYPEVKNEIKS